MTIGAMEALKAPADGHTLLSVTAPITAVPALLPNAPFRIERDFAPLIHVATGYNVLVVNPKVPVRSVAQHDHPSPRNWFRGPTDPVR